MVFPSLQHCLHLLENDQNEIQASHQFIERVLVMMMLVLVVMMMMMMMMMMIGTRVVMKVMVMIRMLMVVFVHLSRGF